MTHCLIDHLVVTTPTLEKGAEFIEHLLGVPMQPGGEHPLMGTHNLLLSLGPSCYLEVIACSPTLTPPQTPRWFNMDQLTTSSEPALTSWVARTNDINQATTQASEELGAVKEMFRGNLNWLITIPSAGLLPLRGTAPALIQWQTDRPPATRLKDQGLTLEQLELYHPHPKQLNRLLKSLNMAGPITVKAEQTPGLAAYIRSASGIHRLPQGTL